MKLAEILRARVRQREGFEGEGFKEGLPAAVETGGERDEEERMEWIPIRSIDPSPFQARSTFDDAAGEELAASIEQHGVLQPIVVRPKGSRFELVVGERRWRACMKLGWDRIPAIIRGLPDREAAEMVMIENLQRRDLNPIETALGYQRLLAEFNLTQQSLAERLGISQSAVANKLRLLKLPGAVREYVAAGQLSERHARAILRVPEESQGALAAWAIREEVTVRELEARVAELVDGGSAPTKTRRAKKAARGAKAGEAAPGAEGICDPAASDPRVEAFMGRLQGMVAALAAEGVPVQMEKDEGPGGLHITLRIPGTSR